MEAVIRFFRALVVVIVLALIAALLGSDLVSWLRSLGPIGVLLTTALTVCTAIWTLIMLVGMVFIVRGGLGEYFWLGAPVVTALALSIGLMARVGADPSTTVAYATVGSLVLYGVADGVHGFLGKQTPHRQDTASD